MRTLVVAIAAIASLTMSASAQQQNPGAPPWAQLPKMNPSDRPQEEASTVPKADDKAYRSALDGIPQTKGHDPWGGVREVPKSKSAR